MTSEYLNAVLTALQSFRDTIDNCYTCGGDAEELNEVNQLITETESYQKEIDRGSKRASIREFDLTKVGN